MLATGLEVRDLHLWRGERHVLRGLSFTVLPGNAVHVRGPNGVGKTSLLRTLAGFLWPEAGAVHWRGKRIEADRDAYAAALAYLGHENALKADLTARENLAFSVGVRRRLSRADADAALERVGVAAQSELPARSLSAGQRRRVAMARVLLCRAPLWLLDEPATNLDVAGTATFLTLIAEHVAAGGIALFTAHAELAFRGPLATVELT